jgi:hypothetical protein
MTHARGGAASPGAGYMIMAARDARPAVSSPHQNETDLGTSQTYSNVGLWSGVNLIPNLGLAPIKGL